MQHHDGITGTSKKSVRDDYTQLLYNGSTYGEEVYDFFLSQLFIVDCY